MATVVQNGTGAQSASIPILHFLFGILVMFALIGRCLHSAVMRGWALTEVESAEPLRLRWGAGPESNDFPLQKNTVTFVSTKMC